jgi:hypothetical protein
MILYADHADGVVNTTNLNRPEPIKQFALGVEASPNDISVGPCFGNPAIMFAAISEGGLLGEGKVAYYIAGPGCTTGFQSSGRPDSIVGEVSGLDAPAGLDDTFPTSTAGHFFSVAESGANQIHMLGIQPGTFLPAIMRTFPTGDNPTGIAHKPSLANPAVLPPPGHAYRFYQNLGVWVILAVDGSGAPSNDLYVCVRGAGRVEVHSVTGQRPPPDQMNVVIPGVRFVAATTSQ